MSTGEAVGLQSEEAIPEEFGRLIPSELPPDPESLPAVTAAVLELSRRAKTGDSLIRELAKRGIFVWIEGEAEHMIGLGVHSKREYGRDHEAYVQAILSQDAIERIDMSWANGAGAWPMSSDRGAAPSAELIATLEDIANIKESLDRAAEEERLNQARIAAWHPVRFSDPAYRTHLGN